MDQYNPQNPVYPQNTQPQNPNNQYPQQPYNQQGPAGYPQQPQPGQPGYNPQAPQQGYNPQYPPQQNGYMPPQQGPYPSPDKRLPDRKSVAVKLEELIYVLLVSLELLLGVRFVLKLIGANPRNPVVNVLYEFTGIFITPFEGFFSYRILNDTRVLQSVFEWETLIAMGVFAVLGFIVVKLIDLFR